MSETESPPLVWEDEATDSERWWMARAKDVTPGGRYDYFLVEDAVTATYVGVVLAPRGRHYRVIAVADGAAALSRLKAAVSAARGGRKHRAHGAIVAWRLRRASLMTLRDLPLAILGFAGGVVLGLLVSLMIASSRIVGWPVVIAGLAIGACAGPAVKYLVDRRPPGLPVRPWARFTVVTVSAALGAAAGVGTTLTLVWN